MYRVPTSTGDFFGFSIQIISWDVLLYTFFFYRQLDFSPEPGVANEILENEAKSRLAVA